MKTPPKIGILGCGEVGKALMEFYNEPLLADVGFSNLTDGLDVLNICIPWSDSFEPTVLGHCLQFHPALVIIHSTVPVGTTFSIYNQYPFTVHSPVRGQHPNLSDGLRTFVKFIGSDDVIVGARAEKHLGSLGMPVVNIEKSKTTELLKLLDTTYYGLCIAFHDYASKLCDLTETDFDIVMTAANITYNQGYSKLEKFQYIRPILKPPSGPIGGHCIIPNLKLLLNQFGSNPMLQSIMNLKENF